jgi:hypothetical protein
MAVKIFLNCTIVSWHSWLSTKYMVCGILICRSFLCRGLVVGIRVFSSEELDKQQELIPEPTTHQYLQPYLHNKPNHNITRPAKQNSTNPIFHTPQVRQDTTGHLLTFSSIFVIGTCILSSCKTEISVQNFIQLKTIHFMYAVLLVWKMALWGRNTWTN